MTAEARAVPFWSDAEIEAGLSGAIAHMRDHKVLAYPTETVYGFGGAVDSDSVGKLIELKGRPADKPFLLDRCGERNDHATRTASVRIRVAARGGILAWAVDARRARRRSDRFLISFVVRREESQ
jgi:hypothetical protein